MREVTDSKFLNKWAMVPVQGTSIADCMALYQRILDNGYKSVLEIGSMYGSSTLWLVKALNEVNGPAQLFTVDSDIEEWGGRGDSQRQFRLDMIEEMRLDKVRHQNFHMTSDQFFALELQMFDMVFVDANHSYEQTKRDIANALKVSSHVLVHDYWHDEGTKKACDEFNGRLINTERGIIEIIK